MTGRTLARIAAVALAGIAITVAALEAARPPAPPVATATPPVPTRADILRETLEQCTALGEAGGDNPACLAAWVENRRRFLGQDGHPPELPPPSDTDPDPAPTPRPDNVAVPDMVEPEGVLR